MHRIDELIAYLDRERAYLDEALTTVPAARHNERPSDEAWCVAQVVHHLAQSEAGMVTLLKGKTEEARAGGVGPDTSASSVLPSVEVRPILDRSRRIKNPRANPSAQITTADALRELETARKDLKALLKTPNLPDLGQISAPHPAFGPISGYHWVAFAAAHMHRHADQIREIGGQLGG